MEHLFFAFLFTTMLNQVAISGRTSPGGGINRSVSISGNGQIYSGYVETLSGDGNSVTGDVNEISGNKNSVKGNVSFISGNENSVTGNVLSISGSRNVVNPGGKTVPSTRYITVKGNNNIVTAHNYGPCNQRYTYRNAITQISNSGIVIEGYTVMYCGFQRYRSMNSVHKGQFLPPTFEDISAGAAATDDRKNVGWLVHYSPNGFKWRTKSNTIIQSILKGERADLINDGGYTEYIASDGSQQWKRNEGIIEKGKFVGNSASVAVGKIYVQVSLGNNNIIRWPKLINEDAARQRITEIIQSIDKN